MKFSSILAATSLAALASAVLPQVVTDAVDALNDLDFHGENARYMANYAVYVACREYPNHTRVIAEQNDVINIAINLAIAGQRAAEAARAAGVLATNQASTLAFTDASTAFDDAAKAGDGVAILTARLYNNFIDLGMTLQDIENNEHNGRNVADTISKAGNALNEARKAALAATELARKAAATCADFADAAAHADVDTAAS